MKPDTFEVGGHKFQLEPLPLKKARALYPHVAKAFGPLLGVIADIAKKAPTPKAEGEESEGETQPVVDLGLGTDFLELLANRFGDVAEATEQVPILQDVFMAHCKWQNPNISSKPWVKLEDFADNVFTRRHALLLEWLIRCVLLEFGDFLPGIGRDLLSILTESGSTSPSGSTGPSGE